MNGQYNNRAGRTGTRKKSGDVLYVYDKICPKNVKKREIVDEYGIPSKKKASGTYTDGSSFGNAQRKRASEYKNTHPYDSRRRADGYSQRKNSRAYSYKAETPRHGRGSAFGGAAVRDKVGGGHFKMIIEQIINLFESIEDRGKADEEIAKQRAIAKKRFLDHKNTIITAIVVILVTILFLYLGYKIAFVVNKIEINGTTSYGESEILEASGISEGDNLFSFDKDRAEADITFRCPYIMNAEVSRTVPETVMINLEADTAMYSADVWGEYLVLSPNLRVLDTTTKEEAAAMGLTELVLPPVAYSVSGRSIQFQSARDERFIRDVLEEIAASALHTEGYINKIDFSDEFNMTMQVGGKYLLRLGGESDCDLKLKMAKKTIDKLAEENSSPARIDLTTVGEASVRFDMQLSFD